MAIIDARDLIAFPGGANASDTVIGGVHFNLTTLDFWNYTLYSNGTLSNGSWCILTFPPYTPSLLYPNGSFVNVTWCYTAIEPLGVRGGVGIGFAVAFGLSLVLTLLVLRKHGRLYLPAEKRFYPIGRRWQFYWAIFVCVAGLISLFTNIDVDRYYLPELPIVLTSFFWFLMQQGTMAVVWEAVRHWGSWMERQYIDPNPFALRQDDRRSRVEFYLPLWFYLWLWLSFFLIVPRNWGEIELQRSPDQTIANAIPGSTDGRFRAAAFCLLICWLTTVASLWHSIRHYKPRNRGTFNRVVGIIRFTPFRFQLLLPLALAAVAYQALIAWEWAYSLLNVGGDVTAIFLGGYAPALLIVIVQILAGFVNPNEDRELIRQRRVRGDQVDRELGIVHKPAWWKRVSGDGPSAGEGMRDRIARNVRELGGGRATARKIDRALAAQAAQRERDAATAETGPYGTTIEMNEMRRLDSGSPLVKGGASSQVDSVRRQSTTTNSSAYGGKSDRRRTERTMAVAAGLLFPTAEGSAAAVTAESRRTELMRDGPPEASRQPPPPYQDRGRTREAGDPNGAGTARPGTAERSTSTGTTSTMGPLQQVRSMLDV